jgi:SOS-response transcriptional repressor LexA
MESFEPILKNKSLTTKQQSILEAILFLIRKGELPTVREVGALVGLRSPATVLKHLRILEQAKLISLSGKSRGIRIADEELLRWLFASGEQDGESPERTTDGTGEGSPADGTAREGTATEGTATEADHKAVANNSKDSGENSATAATKSESEILHVHLAQSSRRGGTLRLEARPRAGQIMLAGAIAAGQPFESYADGFLSDSFSQDPMDDGAIAGRQSLPIDPHLFASGGELFALRIEGDSMIRAGILDGDYVIVRRQNEVEEGEIAAVLIDGEGTLKRWSSTHGQSSTKGEDGNGERSPSDDLSGGDSPRRGRTLRLLPANERFEPIEVHEDEGKDVLVLGKYIGLVRGDLQIA